jgi:hypothetical protein
VIQGTLGAGDELLRDSRVVRGGIDALMTEHGLNDADIRAVFQQVRGEGVPPIPGPE